MAPLGPAMRLLAMAAVLLLAACAGTGAGDDPLADAKAHQVEQREWDL